MNTAELLVRCLENEGVKVVFGIPGEENLAMMNALARSSIRFITAVSYTHLTLPTSDTV